MDIPRPQKPLLELLLNPPLFETQWLRWAAAIFIFYFTFGNGITHTTFSQLCKRLNEFKRDSQVMNQETISPAYKHFLSFFKLTQRERLDGLDASYFSELTPEEKDKAFEYLKDKFDISNESIRGLYLCDPEKAIALFKETLKKPLVPRKNSWENEAAFMGRVMMSGYICNVEPTKEHIDYLADFEIFDKDEDVRNTLYKLIPGKPTTEKALALLKKAIFFESERSTAASSIMSLMSIYGLRFDMDDENYKKIYQGLRSEDTKLKQATIEKLESSYTPTYAE